MRELAAQAASATIGDPERILLQIEVQAMIDEIDRFAAATEFNGQPLLDGSLVTFIVHFGVDDSVNSQIDLVAVGAIPAGGADAAALGVDTIDISTAVLAQAALTTLDTATDTVITIRAGTAAVQNRFTRIINTQAAVIENLTAAESQIRDADIAAEIALLTRNQILVESATAMVGQANLIPQTVLQLLG
jgi:flagellin